MFVKELQSKHLNLYYNDTALSGADETFKKLSPYLEALLEVFENWFWGKKSLDFALSAKVPRVEFNMTLCGQKMIKRLNREYREKDKVTDVLSFQMHDDFDDVIPGTPLGLGDLFICRERAQSQSKDFNISYEDEILHLVVHGLLHLCGFDHELGEEEEKQMLAREDYLVGLISKKMCLSQENNRG